MIRALSTAATGLEAQQAKIANIANDLANVNTDGYKRTNTEFHDLMYQTLKEPGGSLGASTQSPVGVQVGMGVRVGAAHKNFEQGPSRVTGNPLDLAIQGTGFFQVQTPQGEVAFTRAGSFHVDAQGMVQLSGGHKILPQITIPKNAASISISHSGEVIVQVPGSGDTVVGQLQLASFQNPEGLIALGEGLYKTSGSSGAATQGTPGEAGLGFIQQGELEGSNVNVTNSMVDMISTQRGYEMGTKLMGVVDQMLGATVNIK
ncbi:MAG: flagellar basal-body rod protein FlgG [Bdellovibrionia bacterium]